MAGVGRRHQTKLRHVCSRQVRPCPHSGKRWSSSEGVIDSPPGYR